MVAHQNEHLLLNKELSDVTLVIDNVELPAHRAILSEASEYFNTMFSCSFAEAKSDKIELKETNLNAFKIVLTYIYTGSTYMFKSSRFTLEESFEILSCARFYMVEAAIEKAVELVKQVFEANAFSPIEMLNFSYIHSASELISFSENQLWESQSFFDDTEIQFLKTCPTVLPETVAHVLKFCITTPELFEAFIGWMRANPKYSSLFTDLLQYIELQLLSEKELEMLFEPSELVDRNFCLHLLNDQRQHAEKVSKIEDQNVIKGVHGLRIVRGQKYRYKVETFVKNKDANYIDIDLKQQFLLNCIMFRLKKLNVDNDNDELSYTVSVSLDIRKWTRIIDHSNHKCFGQQILYFNKRPIRFIRIEACSSDQNLEFCVKANNIKALYSTDSIEIDPVTTFLIPKRILLMKELRLKSCDHFNRRTRLYIGYDIIFQLPQPCIIDSMKLLFNYPNSYHLNISTTAENWIRVFSEDETTGWRIATFEKQPVTFIKISSKDSSCNLCLFKLEFPVVNAQNVIVDANCVVTDPSLVESNALSDSEHASCKMK